MSWSAIEWAQDATTVRGSTYAVLVVLARFADPVSGECWPGVRAIARRAHVSTATVGPALDRLERAELVELVERGIGTRPSRYRLPAVASRPDRDATGVSVAIDRDADRAGGIGANGQGSSVAISSVSGATVATDTDTSVTESVVTDEVARARRAELVEQVTGPLREGLGFRSSRAIG